MNGILKKFNTLLKKILLPKLKQGAIYSVGQCPKCSNKVLEFNGFYSCSGNLTDDCDFKVSTQLENKKVSFKEISNYIHLKKLEASGLLNKEIDNILSVYEKSLDNNKTTYQKDESKIVRSTKLDEQKESIKILGKCPKCGGNITYNKPKYSCNHCDYSLNGYYQRAKINPTQIEKLLKGHPTEILKFTNKNGEKYDGKLILDKKNYTYKIATSEKEVPKTNSTSNKNNASKNTKILGKCPICKANIIKGNNSYGCMNIVHKKCNFKIPFVFEEVKLNTNDIANLLNGSTITKDDKNIRLDKGTLETVPF